jgi:hypothetical protein
MARYQIITLVDITRSNAPRSETNRIKQGQQANFNSLIQAIGMRSNIDWSSDPKMNTGRIPNQTGKANHWIWTFNTERERVFYKDADDPVGLLLDDLNGIPVVDQLNNSVDLNPPIFKTKGDDINTYVIEIVD